MLNLLHAGHPGTTRMKSLARLHVWWPNIDKDIEYHTNACTSCATAARDPMRVPLHQWELPLRPWQRVHIDYAGPFKGKMWLLMIDAFSKWPEIHEMKTTTAEATISMLKQIFAAHGLPERIISDNGPQFIVSQFEKFCRFRGIVHSTIAPYQPRSNGEIKRLVETFKTSIEKANPSTEQQLQDGVINFLARYRAMPHTVTGQTPSELLNGRRIRTRLDLLYPSFDQLQKAKARQEDNYNAGTKTRQYKMGDPVWARNFRGRERWMAGTIKKKIGNVMYKVVIEDKDMIWRRHTNQLKSRIAAWTIPNSVQPTSQLNDSNPTNEKQWPTHSVP